MKTINVVAGIIKKDNKNTAFLAVFLCRFFIEKISIIQYTLYDKNKDVFNRKREKL